MDNLTLPLEPLYVVRRTIKQGNKAGLQDWWKMPIWYHLSRAQDHLICISAGAMNTENSMFDHIAHALCRLWFATFQWIVMREKREEFEKTTYIEFREQLKNQQKINKQSTNTNSA